MYGDDGCLDKAISQMAKGVYITRAALVLFGKSIMELGNECMGPADGSNRRWWWDLACLKAWYLYPSYAIANSLHGIVHLWAKRFWPCVVYLCSIFSSTQGNLFQCAKR
jgi:hypothetical protein